LGSGAVFAPRGVAALSDQLVGEGDIRRNVGEASAKPIEDRASAFQHESILLGPCHKHVACLQAEASTQRRGHHEPSLGPHSYLYRLVAWHTGVSMRTEVARSIDHLELGNRQTA
jgi:hypothetical protein